jgi:hypothetical protein
MVALRLTGFAGVVPRRGSRLLEANQAQVAVNCRLTSGYIGPLKPPLVTYSPDIPGLLSMYRLESDGVDYWLTWDKDVDVAQGPVAGDTTQRIYYTGDNEPRVTNFALATASTPHPASAYVLGVFPPRTAPTVGHTGGAAANITRAYAYTLVTPWGEESQPSPAGTHTAPSDATSWDLSGMDAAPLNTLTVTAGSWAGGIATLTMASAFGMRVGETVDVTGVNPSGYNGTDIKIVTVNATQISYALANNPGAWTAGGTITRKALHNTTGMTKRIYRTLTGTDAAEFQFVAEIAVANTTYTDTVADSVLGEVLPSEDYEQPPTGMRGLVSLPNGILAGFSINEICFSEPYLPHAWPTEYRQATDFNIVGLGVFQTTIVVGTEGTPYVCTRTEPATMRLARVDQPWPCQAKRGIANLGFGVAYPAPQGLALIGTEGSVLVTKDLYTQEEWAQLFPSTFAAAQYAGRYVASFDAGVNNRQIVIIDKAEFAQVVTANSVATAMWGDPRNGKLYVVIGDAIHEWDADAGQRMSMDWFSKDHVFAAPLNLGAAKVDSDFNMTSDEIAAAQAASDIQEALNAALIAALDVEGSVDAYSVNGMALNGSKIKALPTVSWDSLTFQLFVNGQLKYAKTLTDSTPFRLPAGYKHDTYAFRVAGNVTVKSIVVADTMKALKAA